MKKQKKYVFRIALLIIALVGTMAGLILWTNWTVNSNVVTVLKAVDTIDAGSENLANLVSSEKVNKDATTGLNLVNSNELSYYKAAYKIPKGAIITKDYLVTIDTDIGGDTQEATENYVYFPITVNAANTSYGYLSINQVVNIYGIKTVTDSAGTSQKMYGKLATNVQMVNIISGSFQGGGSASCTFKIEREQLNTVVSYVNGGGTLYFLDGSINDGSDAEDFINQALSSTMYSTVKNQFEIMPEKGGKTWEPCELDDDGNIVNEVINIVDAETKGNWMQGFNFKWRNFLPDNVNVKYYDLNGDEGIYFASYILNGSSTITVTDPKTGDPIPMSKADEYFTHKYTYDSVKGIYTLGSWTTNNPSAIDQSAAILHNPDYSFSDKGYYEIWMDRTEKVTTSDPVTGKDSTTSKEYKLLYKFFVIEKGDEDRVSSVVCYRDSNNVLKLSNYGSVKASYINEGDKINKANAQVLLYEYTGESDETTRNMSPDILANYSSALNYRATNVNYTGSDGTSAVVYRAPSVPDDGITSNPTNSSIKALCSALNSDYILGKMKAVVTNIAANNAETYLAPSNRPNLSEDEQAFIAACKKYDAATFNFLIETANTIDGTFDLENDKVICRNAICYGILNGCEGENGIFNLLPTFGCADVLQQRLNDAGRLSFDVSYRKTNSTTDRHIFFYKNGTSPSQTATSSYRIEVFLND